MRSITNTKYGTNMVQHSPYRLDSIILHAGTRRLAIGHTPFNNTGGGWGKGRIGREGKERKGNSLSTPRRKRGRGWLEIAFPGTFSQHCMCTLHHHHRGSKLALVIFTDPTGCLLPTHMGSRHIHLLYGIQQPLWGIVLQAFATRVLSRS